MSNAAAELGYPSAVPDTAASEPEPSSSDVLHQYFAYGLNMDETEMVQRCRQAQPRGRGALANHRFVINRRGVATVVPDAGATVHGLLWDLTSTDLDALDRFEGVPRGYYTRQMADVLSEDGLVIPAAIYVASEAIPGDPRAGYLERIIEAARRHGFPSGYLEELEAWLTTGGSTS